MKSTSNNNRENIKRVALQLFTQKGFENVTIAEICEKAKCSTSTFYYQFGTKDNLLDSYTKVNSVIDQSILSSLLVLSSAWAKLWRIHETFVDSHTRLGASLYKRIFCKYILSDENWSESEGIAESTELIIPLIMQGQEQGEIRNHTPAEELAKSVTIHMIGTTIMWCADNGSYDLKPVMKNQLINLYDLSEELRSK